jgi:hypothetical protein
VRRGRADLYLTGKLFAGGGELPSLISYAPGWPPRVVARRTLSRSRPRGLARTPDRPAACELMRAARSALGARAAAGSNVRLASA